MTRSNPSGINTIIFDLGGTLVEYAGEHASWPDLEGPGLAAAHTYLLEQGIRLPHRNRFQTTGYDLLPRRWQMATSGKENLTVPDFLAQILLAFNLPVPPANTLQQAAARYERAVCSKAAPIPGSLEIVAKLKADGYKLGLLSNTMFSGQAHRNDLERFELVSYFDAMLFSADANKWKPNPEAFHHVLNELGASVAESAFVGDDPAADMIGGQRAGLRTVYFASSQRFPPVDGLKPDATIYQLAQLPEAIRQWAL